MKERWRWVRRYKGLYKVSDLGRVKSVERMSYGGKREPYRIKEKILKASPFSKSYPYPIVNLTKNGKQKTFAVHDLVLEAFERPRPPGHEARHFPDRDPTNCRATNLWWGTRQQNQADRIIHGTTVTGEKHPNCKYPDKIARKAKRLYKTGRYSQQAIADMFGANQSTVRSWVHGLLRKEVTNYPVS